MPFGFDTEGQGFDTEGQGFDQAQVLKTTDFGWSVRAQVTKTTDFGWSVLARVTKTTDFGWSLGVTQVLKTVSFGWSVLARVTKITGFGWNIGDRIHPRKLIRDAAGAALAGLGVPVYLNRATPLISNSWQDDLPAAIVYALDESARVIDQGGSTRYMRTLQLAVEINVSATVDADNALDSYCELVENLITQDDSLGGVCDRLVLTNTRLALRSESDTIIAAAVIFFDVTYLDSLPRTSVLDTLSGIVSEIIPQTEGV